MTQAFHIGQNIPAGGKHRAGCAPFARRGETKGTREALIMQTAPTPGRAA